MERRDDFGRRGRGRPIKPVKPFPALTRGVLRGLVEKPWRSLLSGVGIAMGMILSAKIFVLTVIVLLAALMAVDICDYFLDSR